MKFEITVIDKDYRALSNQYYKEFLSKEEAEKYCDEKSWSGADYFYNLISTGKD